MRTSGARREGDGADSPTRTKKTALFLKVLFFFVKRLAQIFNELM
jgi:hypothetical protein